MQTAHPVFETTAEQYLSAAFVFPGSWFLSSSADNSFDNSADNSADNSVDNSAVPSPHRSGSNIREEISSREKERVQNKF